jgi:pimeloyl-ACP methyl ester carboxylesterase
MAYKEWGDPRNPDVLVCVHGVTRVSDDFDALAETLSKRYRVVCPDIVGRGRSGWLADARHYIPPQYVSDMVTLLAKVDAKTVHWVGTSLGGMIGMVLASMKNTPISRLVLNDIGPELEHDAVMRIREYIGKDVRFPTREEAVAYMKSILASFGSHTAAEWDKLAGDALRQDKDGTWIRHYDLRLAQPFLAMTPESVDQSTALLWAAYDAISCPTLLIRGAESDLLSKEVATEMTRRGPKAKLVEIADAGHAPSLMHDDQIAIVKEFLLG